MFKFKTPSQKTLKVMSEVASGKHDNINFENSAKLNKYYTKINKLHKKYNSKLDNDMQFKL